MIKYVCTYTTNKIKTTKTITFQVHHMREVILFLLSKIAQSKLLDYIYFVHLTNARVRYNKIIIL